MDLLLVTFLENMLTVCDSFYVCVCGGDHSLSVCSIALRSSGVGVACLCVFGLLAGFLCFLSVV